MDSNAAGRPSTLSQAYILGLPNELLSLIFTFLFHSTDAYVSIGPADPNSNGTILVDAVLVVRWVCIRFRQIASRHTIWLDDAYTDLAMLFAIGSQYDFKPIKMKQDYIAGLLDDDELCSILRRKSAWQFTTSETFLAVTGRQPSLVSGARDVRLLTKEADTRLLILMGKLNVFSSLTNLSISFTRCYWHHVHCFLDLDIIAHGCPLLEDICLTDFVLFGGSLAPLQHIQNLSIVARDLKYVDEICYLIPLLPSASAHCLMRVKFLGPMTLDSNVASIPNPLEPFTRLSFLEINESHPHIYDWIATANFSLHHLSVSVYGDIVLHGSGSTGLLRMLSSTSLKDLKQLTFVNGYRDFYGLEDIDLCYSLEDSHIFAITNLEHLEHLGMSVSLRKDLWLVLTCGGRLRDLWAWVDAREFDEEEYANDLEAFTSRIRNLGGFSEVVVDKTYYSEYAYCFFE